MDKCAKTFLPLKVKSPPKQVMLQWC